MIRGADAIYEQLNSLDNTYIPYLFSSDTKTGLDSLP